MVSPFVYLVVTSFTAEKTGDFTFANYATAYGRARYVDALINSLKLGARAALLAGVFAVPLAWAVARTDMPGRGFTRMLVLATFITPPYTGAVAWILLAGPNAGWLNRFFMMVTGAEAGPFNIYSFTGLAVVIALYSFPYIFIFTTAALELVSSEMEDAANILGAGAWRTMRQVTLPLALPAILGGLIICFLEAIALFGSPAMIAIPARFNVVTTQLFQFFGNPVRVEVAAAYAMPLLGVTILLILIQRLMTRRKGFVALTGKGGERRPIRLGTVALGDVRLCHVRGGPGGVPALPVPDPGGLRQGLGTRLRAGQHLAQELPFRAVRARHGGQVGDQQLRLCRHQRHGGGDPDPGRRLHRRRAGWCRSAASWASCAWRRS